MPPTPVLDPTFHQSIWKPWNESALPAGAGGAADAEEQQKSSTGPAWHRGRWAGWSSVVAGMLILALVGLPILVAPRPFDPTPSMVLDLPTTPTIGWTAEGTDACSGGFTENHTILTDSGRISSVDLRTGEEAWSLIPTPPTTDIVCLPGANVVAVTDDPSQSGPPTTSLLDGSSGEVLGVLPSATAIQVIPLGRHIGLMSPEGTLSMVAKEDPLVPLWSHEFPRVAQPSTLYATPIDAETVQLVRWSTGGRDSEANFATTVLSLEDGSVPDWFSDPGAAQTRYSIIDGVVISTDFRSRPVSTARDARGNQVWRRGGVATIGDGGFEYATVSDDRLFFNVAGGTGEASRVSEADPGTGIEDKELSHSGDFTKVLAVPSGGIAVVSSRGATLLDEGMQPRATIDGDGSASLPRGGVSSSSGPSGKRAPHRKRGG